LRSGHAEDVPEGHPDPEEQADQQTPRRRSDEPIEGPPEQRTTDEPTQQIGQYTVAGAIIRIGLA